MTATPARLHPQESVVLAAWQAGVDVPLCIDCSSLHGPFTPTGQWRPSGAQVFRCADCSAARPQEPEYVVTDRAQDDEQAAAQRSVDRAFPAVAAFLASADTQGDADPMRVDAPQVDDVRALLAEAHETYTNQRTHTIRLLDTPGATLTVTCPEWCQSDHAEDVVHGTFLVDFAHRGWEEALHVDLGDGSTEDVLLCEITQYPFGRDMRKPVAVMWPTLGMTEAHLEPAGVRALADQLRTYADALDDLSVELMDARNEGQADR